MAETDDPYSKGGYLKLGMPTMRFDTSYLITTPPPRLESNATARADMADQVMRSTRWQG